MISAIRSALQRALDTSEGFSIAVAGVNNGHGRFNLIKVYEDAIEVVPLGQCSSGNRTFIALHHIVAVTIEED